MTPALHGRDDSYSCGTAATPSTRAHLWGRVNAVKLVTEMSCSRLGNPSRDVLGGVAAVR